MMNHNNDGGVAGIVVRSLMDSMMGGGEHDGHSMSDTDMDMDGDSNDGDSFCSGMPMIMYMDGFHVTLRGGHGCLNLYFADWTLDSRGKFFAAMIGVFVMAVSVEGMSKLRHNIVLVARRQSQQQQQPPSSSSSNNEENGSNGWNSNLLRWSITLMHGTQALLGYVLMLATMTFSVELILAVVFGLSVGYAVFYQLDDESTTTRQHVTTNPCCNFLEEEAKEVTATDSADAGLGATVESNSQDGV